MKKARYRDIPVWFNPITNELQGRNVLAEVALVIMVYLDTYFFMPLFNEEEYPIMIEE